VSFTKEEFNVVVVGLVRGYKQAYDLAAHDFVAHCLAVECLKQAVGPGLDPKALAEFAKLVETWVTLPAVGFVPLVLRAGGTKLMDTLSGSKTPSILGEAVRSAKGLNAPGRGLAKVKVPVDKDFLLRAGAPKLRPPRALPVPGLKTVPMTRVFDPTGALNWGFRILAELGPLLGALQMHEARLVVMNPNVVPRAWTAKVGQILAKARQPEQLKAAYQASLEQLNVTWDYLLQSVAEMEIHRRELGLPAVAL